jgi:hypothetical protein
MIHSEGGPRAHRKARTLSQRCKLGLPITRSPICIHCICPFSEQKIPGRVFSRVSNPNQVTMVWLLFLQCQGPNLPHLIYHQMVSKIGTSIQVSVQHHQVNAPGDRVLLQKVTSQLQNLVGISDCSYIPIECQHSSPSVTVASKGPEDTHFPLAFGGTCHFLKRSSYERSYTKEIMQTV